MTDRKCLRVVLVFAAMLAIGGLAAPAGAQVTPPDLSVCDGVDCDNLQESICSAAGFKITLKSFIARQHPKFRNSHLYV